ncbi:MAG: transcription termination/antitermination protein NusG [Chlamydiales bacterium]|nr:transcription termination/antitermination protein NusG [Chlamydiales bacterium]
MSGEWFVVQVMSGHEKKAKKAIEEGRLNAGMQELVQEVLVPTENVAEVKGGERKIVEKRLWPGYILVRMSLTDESWMYIKDSTSVIDFLGGGKPEPLTQKEVEEILSELKDKKEEVVLKHQFNEGDAVKIVDGVFVNFVGNVVEVNQDKGRLTVMVSIFGRDTRVEDLEFWQVEEVGEDN